MARKRFTGGKFNTSLMIDTLIASLLVQKAPEILNRFLFSGNPVTGQTATLLGVGAAYLYGMFMKNNNVSNIGIALGAVEFVTPFIDDILNQVTGSAAPVGIAPVGYPTSLPNIKTIPTRVSDTGYFRINDYGTLSDYTENPENRQGYNVYKDSY
jgi:hypothetical protein